MAAADLTPEERDLLAGVLWRFLADPETYAAPRDRGRAPWPQDADPGVLVLDGSVKVTPEAMALVRRIRPWTGDPDR